jgi:hypothetical protein
VLRAQPSNSPHCVPRLPAVARSETYSRAATRSAAQVVSTATEGARHGTLCREAFALARLSLAEEDITEALLPAALTAGLPEREAVRAIHDAVRARRGAA